MANAPTNSDPQDIAGWQRALDAAMQASEAIQAMGTGVGMSAESIQQPDVGQQGSVT